jgi:outer membrane protein assembly factor BamB
MDIRKEKVRDIQMPYLVGQQLGNYRLIRLLGQGGFAEVYLGEHIHLNTLAAIKVLHAQLTEREVAQFRKESKMIANLNHPNIVRVLDFDVEREIPFLVMEYAPYGTLRQQHPRGELVPLDKIVSYVKQCAEALQYAHERKIIHRDVKPGNMLLGQRNEVLLSDFGVATIAHHTSSQSTQTAVGTISYMAPEQIQGKPHVASDQYSLAIVVYEWLCGELPFTGAFAEIAAKQCLVQPPSLIGKVPTIPLDLELVILTALAKAPDQRFASVKAFADILEQVSVSLQKKSIQSNIYSTLEIEKGIIAEVTKPHLQASVFTPEEMPGPASISSYSTQSLPPGARVSRRTVVAGLAGLALVGGTASAVLFLRKSPGSTSAHIPSPTSIPTQRAFNSAPTSTSAPASTSPIPPAQPTIYIGSTDSFFYALKGSDGSVLWSYHGGDWMNAIPVVAEGIVYAGSNDHSMYSLRASSGELLWRYQTGDKVVGGPVLVNGVLYFGSWDRYIYALQISDGSLLWQYLTGGMISSMPQVTDGVVYIGSNDQYVYAIQAQSGKLLWRSQTSGYVAEQVAVSDGVVYVGSGDSQFYALRTSDGEQIWHYQTGGAIYSSPMVVHGVVYFGSSDSYVYALRAKDGGLIWRYQADSAVTSWPTILDDILYIGSSNGVIYALQANNGLLLWSHQTGETVSSKPIIAAGVIYIGSSKGLFALKASDGSLLWNFAAGGGAVTTPAVFM